MKTPISEEIAKRMAEHYPHAKATLDFASPYQCLVAVMLSAQTTDVSVNAVTPVLFCHYPTPKDLAEASLPDVEKDIHSLGLYKTKAVHLIEAMKIVETKFGGDVPSSYEDLVSLPGVGAKVASVTRMEAFGVPTFPVDTHVGRISKRLGLAESKDTPIKIQAKLERIFSKEEQADLHHRFIAFGRDICHAQNPECERCFLKDLCPYFASKNTEIITGK